MSASKSRIGILALLLAAPIVASAATDTPVVTIGSESGGFVLGFAQGLFGSISPTKTANGHTYNEILTSIGAHGGASVVNFSGFTANPGSTWLTSIKCGSHSVTFPASTYSYSSGTASWQFTVGALFVMGETGMVTCTIVHS